MCSLQNIYHGNIYEQYRYELFAFSITIIGIFVGGVWQHVTSRDLLICWEEFLTHIGQSEEQQYEICEASAVCYN